MPPTRFPRASRAALVALLASLVVLTTLPPIPIAGARPEAQPTVTLTGAVAATNLVTGATVQVFPVVNGQIGATALAQGQTTAGGAFSLTLAATTTPLVIQATGGTFTDPALNQSQTLSVPLHAALPSLPSGRFVAVTPFSEAAVRLALGSSGGLTEANIVAGNQAGNTFLFGVDILATPPKDPTNSATAGATAQEKAVAIALGAISQYRFQQSQTLGDAIALIVEVIQFGGTLLSAGGGFSSDPENETIVEDDVQLLTAFSHLVASPLNRTGVPSAYKLYEALGLTTIPGGTPGAPWTQACQDSVTADFAARDQLPQSPVPQSQWASIKSPWGPAATIYPIVTIPTGCDPVLWQQARVLAVIAKYVQSGINYCHHYIPGWVAPPEFRGPKSCSPAKEVYQGLDCSNFTAWYYDYAFGGWRMNSQINEQAGQPMNGPYTFPSPATENYPLAAGVMLKDASGNYLTHQNILQNINLLQPGDLLYLYGYGDGSGPPPPDKPQKVAHVITWTGLTVQQLGLSQISSPYQQYAKPDDWVIADSHYDGPNYRPFTGPWGKPPFSASWKATYASNVWGVRRLIQGATPPPTTTGASGGVANPTTGLLSLKTTPVTGTPDLVFQFGPLGAGSRAVALLGDWNGDGVATPGWYDPDTAQFFLRNSNTGGQANVIFPFGSPVPASQTTNRPVPVVGDWTGQGFDGVGLYDPVLSRFHLRVGPNQNGALPTNVIYVDFGNGSQVGGSHVPVVPVTGNWAGSNGATTKIGLYVPSTSQFLLKNSLPPYTGTPNPNNAGHADVVVTFGVPNGGYQPLTGDWNGDGKASVGLYLPSLSRFFLRNQLTAGVAETTFSLTGVSAAGVQAVAGVLTPPGQRRVHR